VVCGKVALGGEAFLDCLYGYCMGLVCDCHFGDIYNSKKVAGEAGIEYC
jgi:hypothetical protein